jgi:hypothetical protein
VDDAVSVLPGLEDEVGDDEGRGGVWDVDAEPVA